MFTLKEYDAVGLLCRNASHIGGELKISNFANAWEKLKLRLPKFLQYELLRPLPRDVLEKGKGVGNDSSDLLSQLSRGENFLPLRVKRNSYPIVIDKGDKMQFRYMRHWIETGHSKSGLPLSPLLTIAMDFLDEALDNECIFNENLKQGDILYANNKLIAHSRNAFQDDPTKVKPQRHMIRAWIQIRNKE